VRIESVTRLVETADVWDITVPDGHWFSLANGAVVHNSDAFGLACICADKIFVETQGWGGKIKFDNRGIV
jgi:hypothetical protein